MIIEFGKRRAEIMAFLRGLGQREKLIARTYLSNNTAISSRIPDLAMATLEMHRAHHKLELLKLVGTEHSNLDLGLPARRKGCHLEHAEGPGDRWRIVATGSRGVQLIENGPRQVALTRKQALEILRSLPDQQRKA